MSVVDELMSVKMGEERDVWEGTRGFDVLRDDGNKGVGGHSTIAKIKVQR